MPELSVTENPSQIACSVFRYRIQTSPPPVLEIQVPGNLVFTDFAVYFAITRLFFEGILFDKFSFQLVVDIWSKV
jgi:hypothetical protein